MPLGPFADVSKEPRSHFKDDSSVSACELCDKAFGGLFGPWKHHCRMCGGIFCDSCSAEKCEVPGFSGKQRVCGPCHRELNPHGGSAGSPPDGEADDLEGELPDEEVGDQTLISAQRRVAALREANEWKAQGNAALQAQDFEGAVAAYTTAIALDGTNHVYYSNRSAAYASSESFTNALADAERCLQLEPSFARGYGRKGAALHGLGQLAGAEQAYTRGLEMDPENQNLRHGLMKVKRARAQTTDSLERTCPGGHRLQPFVTSHAGMVCDICRSQPPGGAQMHGCRACDYDECSTCVAATPNARKQRSQRSQPGSFVHPFQDPFSGTAEDGVFRDMFAPFGQRLSTERAPAYDPFALLEERPLLSPLGMKTTEELSLRGKTAIGLFFSGHWCPPSREFTPRLIASYQRWARAKNFEIVFISSDRTQVPRFTPSAHVPTDQCG
eukprot:COSAG03_NODE_16_length_21807_cov_27.080247_4_plen_442_part_00